MTDRRKRFLTLVLAFFMTFFCAVPAFAAETTDSTGRPTGKNSEIRGELPVLLPYENDREVRLNVLIRDDIIYCEAGSFAKSFGCELGHTDESIQFYFNNTALNYILIADYKLKSTKVRTFDGKEKSEYTAPCKTIRNDSGTWIPLTFALKIFGREICVNNGVIFVTSAMPNVRTLADQLGTESGFIRNLETIFYLNHMKTNEDFEGTPRHLLLETVTTRDSYDSFFSGILSTYAGSAPVSSDADAGELAAYLLSDNSEELSAYLNSTLYSARLYLCVPDLIDTFDKEADKITGYSPDQIRQWGKRIIEDSARRFLDSNSPSLALNEDFRLTYMGLTGYDPVNKIWTDDAVYDQFLALFFCYSDDAAVIAGTNASAGCMRYMTDETFALDAVSAYLNNRKDDGSSQALITELSRGVAGYDLHRNEVIKELDGLASGSDFASMARGGVKKFLDEVGKTSPVPGGLFALYDADDFVVNMDPILNEEFLGDYGSYRCASDFFDRVSTYSGGVNENLPTYLALRTEYTSTVYLQKCLANPLSSEYFYQDDVYHTLNIAAKMKRICAARMALLSSGIEYGLTSRNNQAFNAAYDDSNLAIFTESAQTQRGNTNGNINAGGFAAASERYFYFTKSSGKSYYREIETGIEYQISDRARWMNIWSSGDSEYLFYIDINGDVIRFDPIAQKAVTLLTGPYTDLMIAYGYLMIRSGRDLIRYEMRGAELHGGPFTITDDVGKCVAYDSDLIVYSDVDGDVISIEYDGSECTPLCIRSESIDLADGIVYFADSTKNGIIHIFNISLNYQKSLSAETQNAYCLQYRDGMIYYKVDNDTDSSLVYSVSVTSSKPSIRAYSRVGLDNDDVPLSDLDLSVRDSRRQFNICNGMIFNEDFSYEIRKCPLSNFSLETVVSYLKYFVSTRFDK